MPAIDPVQYPRVYRGISKKRWFVPAERKVLSAAFKLRPGEIGLSMLKTADCSVAVCRAERNECYGEFGLATGDVLALGLGVVDDDPGDPTFSEIHAEVRGLPPFEDELQAELSATTLADLATLHYDRFGKYA